MRTLVFTEKALKDLQKLDKLAKRRIIKTLHQFRLDDQEALPLTGSWKNWYKLRVGNYRILLTKERNNIWIVGYLRHRKEVYTKQ